MRFARGDWVYDVFLPITPKTGQGAYKRKYLALLRDVLPRNAKHKAIDYPVSVNVTFHFYGKSPSDIDNLFKLLLDGIKTLIIKDDKLIKEIYGIIKEYSPIEGAALKIKKFKSEKPLFLATSDTENDIKIAQDILGS